MHMHKYQKKKLAVKLILNLTSRLCPYLDIQSYPAYDLYKICVKGNLLL